MISPTEWHWQRDGRWYGVRLFTNTDHLIWSSWAETSSGPVFDQGIAQLTAAFLADGPIERGDPPPALVEAVRAALQPPPRRGLLGWLRGR